MALGSFSISAINHVFGSRAISVTESATVPEVGARCWDSPPRARRPPRPSTVMAKPSGTHPRCPLPFLPSAGCRLGRCEVPRFLGGAFSLSGASGLDEAHWQGRSLNPSHRLVHSSPEGAPARALSGIFEMWPTRLCCQHDPPPCSHAGAILSPPQSRLCSHPLRGTFAEHRLCHPGAPNM